MHLYILKDGKPVRCDDTIEWGRWFENPENRRIAENDVNGVVISTVFLGIDHAYNGGEPILYETMVFGGEFDRECERYRSREESLAGHSEWVEKVKASEVWPEEVIC